MFFYFVFSVLELELDSEQSSGSCSDSSTRAVYGDSCSNSVGSASDDECDSGISSASSVAGEDCENLDEEEDLWDLSLQACSDEQGNGVQAVAPPNVCGTAALEKGNTSNHENETEIRNGTNTENTELMALLEDYTPTTASGDVEATLADFELPGDAMKDLSMLLLASKQLSYVLQSTNSNKFCFLFQTMIQALNVYWMN